MHPLQIGWRRGENIEHIITREWLITNGIGGYAAGTIGGGTANIQPPMAE